MRSKILSVQVVLVVSWSILLFDLLTGRLLQFASFCFASYLATPRNGACNFAFATSTFAEWPSDPKVNVPICTAKNAQSCYQLIRDGADGAFLNIIKVLQEDTK